MSSNKRKQSKINFFLQKKSHVYLRKLQVRLKRVWELEANLGKLIQQNIVFTESQKYRLLTFELVVQILRTVRQDNRKFLKMWLDDTRFKSWLLYTQVNGGGGIAATQASTILKWSQITINKIPTNALILPRLNGEEETAESSAMDSIRPITLLRSNASVFFKSLL